MKIHKEGYWYVVIATILYIAFTYSVYTILSSFLWIQWPLYILSFLLYFWVFWFFRIPSRQELTGDQLVISPCDGKVVVIEETEETEYFKDKRIQVSIFMSPLNVHVNKYPISGQVDYVQYHKGKYLVAWHPKSSTENERSTIVVSHKDHSILIRQIAGAVARRIVTYSQKGQQVKQNQELGFIKFGSRVDLYLPIGTQINTKIGDVVQNGVSLIATLK